MKKTIIGAIVFAITSLNATIVKNIDNEGISIKLVNNRANLLSFPFIVDDASLATNDPESYSIKVKKNAIIVIPAVEPSKQYSSAADLIVLARDEYSYLIRVSLGGNDQRFVFTSKRVIREKPAAKKFESGRIDSDVKAIIKRLDTYGNIPGYKTITVKKKKRLPSMILQKDKIFDGARYRVEQWYIKNRLQNRPIFLNPADFYTRGVLAVSIDKESIAPNEVSSMYIIVDKASIKDLGRIK